MKKTAKKKTLKELLKFLKEIYGSGPNTHLKTDEKSKLTADLEKVATEVGAELRKGG